MVVSFYSATIKFPRDHLKPLQWLNYYKKVVLDRVLHYSRNSRDSSCFNWQPYRTGFRFMLLEVSLVEHLFYIQLFRPSFYDLINPSGEKNSSKVNSAPDVIAKKAQYKREIPEQTKEYRFYNSSNMSLDVPEKFGDYGYCFYTYVSCPLDNSSSTHINQIRCKGNYCNKNSTIETIFGSMEDAKTKLTNENRFRCLEKMEDTYCNRCVSCNSTHRAELVEGLHVDLRECSKCPPIMNLNLEKPNEHTLTYLILGE